MHTVNTASYLQRINYAGSLDPTLALLSQLQEAHVLHIPFENLDIHFGIPIELDINRLYHKVIVNRRGGFCYELNGLFYELLIALGFRAKRISAKVFDKINGYGPPYDHLAILVEIDGMDYLTDVGFGEFAFSPLPLAHGIMQHDVRGDFIIEKHDIGYWRVSKAENDALVPQYIFNTTACTLEDFKDMCVYHQTSPLSHFTQQALITRPTPTGRITISKHSVKIKVAEEIHETHLENEDAFREMLLHYFGIEFLHQHGNPQPEQHIH